ncbi:MAG: hypothetical protein LBL49_08215 [Clostridiales Family XIII bacterium]|jgi:hypothetical protein|nr:hypothetical protein [Clostridiales Family XIII bacterium]
MAESGILNLLICFAAGEIHLTAESGHAKNMLKICGRVFRSPLKGKSSFYTAAAAVTENPACGNQSRHG